MYLSMFLQMDPKMCLDVCLSKVHGKYLDSCEKCACACARHLQMYLEVCLGMYLTLAHVPRHVPRNVPETLHALDTFHEKYLDMYQKSTSHDVPGGVLRSVLGTVHALSMCWT